MLELLIPTCASLLLAILALYAVARQRQLYTFSLATALLLLACINLLDVLAVNPSFVSLQLKRVVMYLESLIPLSFLLLSLTFARQGGLRSLQVHWKCLLALTLAFPLAVFIYPTNALFYAPDLLTEKMLFLEAPGYWFYLGIMGYFILALMNLEATFSASGEGDRWKVKLELIGLSALLAVLIFYYSQGLLYRTINMNLLPIRSGVMLIAALLIGYSRLFRGNGVKIVVSRYLFYRSLTLLVVGAYLLILGLIGEALVYFGHSFSRNLTIFIGFAFGIILLIALFSEQVRRRVKVAVNKHLYAQKYDYRSQWLKFTEKLASCRTMMEVYDAILATYRETYGLKGGALYLLHREKGGYCRAAGQGIMAGSGDFQISAALHAYFVEQGRVLNLADRDFHAGDEERILFSQLGARVVIPLVSSDTLEGVVLLGEQLAPEQYIYEDYDLMKTLAHQAASAILNLRLAEQLAQAREMETIGRISAFVIHDLKNLASTLAMIVDNAKDNIDNPEFQHDMLQSIDITVVKMQGLITRLKGLGDRERLCRGRTDLYSLVTTTVAPLAGSNITVTGQEVFSDVDCDEIQKVVLNLVLNAVDACRGEGPIMVEVGENGSAFIRVVDKGCGIDPDFLQNHLFKPFRTTKKKGLGIGLYQCRQIVEAHGGWIDVESDPGSGSVFTVRFPLPESG
jgi:putative PEP-CTERM system histidine kinase